MFPNHVTNHNSFEDSVKILKNRGLLNEGDAVKGTPDKEPSYDSPTPDAKTKYKKVEQSPEVDEQDGIYPATTITDIPKVKANKKVKDVSDGLEPIKPHDTKNEMKKVKVAKATEQTLNENRDTLRESIKRLVREFLDKKKTLN
jgi:mRNA degradation ribonuclease J1/J2